MAKLFPVASIKMLNIKWATFLKAIFRKYGDLNLTENSGSLYSNHALRSTSVKTVLRAQKFGPTINHPLTLFGSSVEGNFIIIVAHQNLT